MRLRYRTPEPEGQGTRGGDLDGAGVNGGPCIAEEGDPFEGEVSVGLPWTVVRTPRSEDGQGRAEQASDVGDLGGRRGAGGDGAGGEQGQRRESGRGHVPQGLR